MTTKKRIYAGARLRAIRKKTGIGQADMASRLNISVSYLSQIENDERPLTTAVLAALSRQFPADIDEFQVDDTARRVTQMRAVLDDPLFSLEEVEPHQFAKWADNNPQLVDRFIRLHAAYRGSEERLHMIDDTLADGAAGSGRLPWEEVRDWFHEAGNYIDLIDKKAEAIASEMQSQAGFAAVVQRLFRRHDVTLETGSQTDGKAPMIAYDRRKKHITLSGSAPQESRYFLVSHQLAALEMKDEIAAIAGSADLRSEESRRLISIGLTNYAAGALIMPYDRFRSAAREYRHDIERLCNRFMVSFEQACHRLSTLQRPGARGVPFFFCRVDMAGNITKRHSATRLQFARFGGACPLWIVHEAVAIPDKVLVQLAETPDGVRYVSMAKGLVKPSGNYSRAPRRYAVALGCEAEHARDFIYADGLDILSPGTATPIGIGCRTCSRDNCDQRAFPPSDRAITINPDRRDMVPYQIG